MGNIMAVKKKLPQRPLFIFEMANNHAGDVQHGLSIIKEMSMMDNGSKDFRFAFKFQYRDLDTFIHPLYKGRTDQKYVKRFTETQLTEEEFLRLKREAERFGFMTICTPFDEASVDKVEAHGYDAVKIASASFTDWPLLERIVLTDLPIIASTGGATLQDIDKVVSFFQHRNKEFALMHCVGEYPTAHDRLQLNQIDLFRQRYPGVPIGFSTHEDPRNSDAVKIAVAKGATIFEKHVGVETDRYPLNAYSATPIQVAQWVRSAMDAYAMCGVANRRHVSSEKELTDVRQFRRGVFAVRNIMPGERITAANSLLAFPNKDGQLLADGLSKYTAITARTAIAVEAPVMDADIDAIDTRSKVYEIVIRSRELLAHAGIAVCNQLHFEISHHYGIDRFEEAGAVIITCVNNPEYAKKLILLFPGQGRHPVHYHKLKKETFHVLHGNASFMLDDEQIEAGPGDIITVERGVRHDFATVDGVVFEEVSTQHIPGDSYYDDPAVCANAHRKTVIDYWVG